MPRLRAKQADAATSLADLIPTMGEADRIDPYFAQGSFLVPAPVGRGRARRRAWVREMAATHKPPLRVSVTSAHWVGDPESLYVLVLGDAA